MMLESSVRLTCQQAGHAAKTSEVLSAEKKPKEPKDEATGREQIGSASPPGYISSVICSDIKLTPLNGESTHRNTHTQPEIPTSVVSISGLRLELHLRAPCPMAKGLN